MGCHNDLETVEKRRKKAARVAIQNPIRLTQMILSLFVSVSLSHRRLTL